MVLPKEREETQMTKEQRLKIISENRTLIEIYSNLKEISTQTDSDELKIAIALLGKATDLLSEV
jgi:hypothetical protein